MPIVSSAYTVGPDQRDGRAYVTETHTDNLGAVFVVEYLASPGVDRAAVLAARADEISGYLADMEAQALADDGV